MIPAAMKHLTRAALAAVLFMSPTVASAHFIWITVEPARAPGGSAAIRTFLNEEPEPGGKAFLKYVKDVKPTALGQPIAASLGEGSLNASWAGALPATIDAESVLGVKTGKDKVSYRLVYTARAQTKAVAPDAPEKAPLLRVRLVTKDGKPYFQALFDGKPVPKVRVKAYPDDAETVDLTGDDQGLVEVAGLAEGKTGAWANWTEAKPGEADGKPYTETRYYATLTVVPEAPKAAALNDEKAAVVAPTSFATMPAPAVNSFGGAVLGDWLYVYSGHVGKTHKYSTETTSKHFRRLNLKDRTTWEDLPMAVDLQGVALVSDGKAVYRLGGMAAKNAPGSPQDLHSVADFARFDPDTKAWTDLAPMPTPRSTHDAAVVGRKIYAVGGWIMKGSSEDSDYCENASVYDLDNPEAGWKTLDQPFRRRALAAAEAEGKLYVVGGLTDDFKVETVVDVYDPAANTWSQAPKMPGSGKTEGFAASAFGIDGRLYMSAHSGVISRLNTDANRWEAIGAWSQPRLTHRLLPGPGHSLLAVGGNYKGDQTPLIESIALPATPAKTSTAAR